MYHGAIRVEGVAESRVARSREPSEEGEEREWREREGVGVDEVYDVSGVERGEELFEGGVQGFRRSVLDGFRQGGEYGVWVLDLGKWRRSVPGGGRCAAGGGTAVVDS